ncbi:MAG: GAF domain-containing protein [Candidatus Omnitrophica bacterium]|nr:GAF domain-containing protein [Candidatus Omnitrophota bacterium]
MNYYYFSITGLINAIAAITLGLFVYYHNKKSEVNQRYALFNLAVFVWSVGYIFWPLNQGNKEACLYWFRVLHIGAIFIPVCFLHFVTAFLKLNKKKILNFGYLIALFFTAFSFSPLFIKDMRPVSIFKYWGTAGMLYYLFLITFVGYAVYACVLLYSSFRKAEGILRSQISYILIGMIIGYVGCSSNYLLFFKLSFPPYLNVVGFIYVAMFAYAIVAYKLLDIEVIIKKTLVFAGLLASVFAMLLLPTLVIQEYIFRGTGTGGKVIGLTISGIIIMLALRRIENFLINVTDKFLFQKKYNYKELLKTFTSEVLTVLDLNRLVRLTVSKLSDIMKLQSCGILLLDEDKGKYDLVASQGIAERNIALGKENTLITFLSRAKTYLSIKPHEKELHMPQQIIEDMNRLKFELAIPLMTLQGDMVGVLTLGKKKSDENYTQDDMDILVPLARTLAIAINNAEMFDELGKTQAEAAQKEKMAVIGTLSAGINHEICNPLGIARGQCEAFLLNIKDGLYKDKSQGELLEKAQNIMGKVIHETDRATAITKRLSSFAKPSKGIISANINVKDEIDEVLALVGYELKLDKVDIVKDIEESLPLLTGDKKQIQEVFFNLIRNAAQAINERGKITIKARQADDKIFIDIEDTGHGIPENKLEQIFNPFYTTKDPGKGTGLGLFIVRQVVERNHGKISVKSKVGEGTTFTLEFPLEVKSKA